MTDEVWDRVRASIDEQHTEYEWADIRAQLELSDEIQRVVRQAGYRMVHWQWNLEKIEGVLVQEGVMGEWRAEHHE